MMQNLNTTYLHNPESVQNGKSVFRLSSSLLCLFACGQVCPQTLLKILFWIWLSPNWILPPWKFLENQWPICFRAIPSNPFPSNSRCLFQYPWLPRHQWWLFLMFWIWKNSRVRPHSLGSAARLHSDAASCCWSLFQKLLVCFIYLNSYLIGVWYYWCMEILHQSKEHLTIASKTTAFTLLRRSKAAFYTGVM